jgi:hypothetical protein
VPFVKFNVVTVLDPAEKLPVRARVVPEAFVKLAFWRAVKPEMLMLVPDALEKFNVVTVLEPALKLPVKTRVVPEASVNVAF